MAESPVQKALLVLKQLAEYGEPAGVKRLAGDLGLNVSTVHRLLQILVSENMASYEPETRLYGLGADCIGFAAKVLGGDSPVARIRPVVRDLVARLEETCAFSLYEPQSFTKALVLVERGPHRLGYDYAVGQRDGIHAGASGKAILAFLPDAEIERLFETAELKATTENTIVEPDALRREIGEIRARGYATSLGERVPGAGFGIGAPVFAGAGRVKGSIVVTVPIFRWRQADLPRMAQAVMASGRVLSDIFAAEAPEAGPEARP